MPDDITQGDNTQQPEKIEPIKLPVDAGVNNTLNEQANSSEQENRTNQPTDNKAGNWVHRNHPIISTIANVIMALGTIAAVFIAGRSLEITNKSFELTRQSINDSGRKDSAFLAAANRTADATMAVVVANERNTKVFRAATEKENRAFIYSTSYDVSRTVDGGLHISFDYENKGNTPAYNFRCHTRWELSDTVPNPSIFAHNINNYTAITINPNTTTGGMEQNVSPETLAELGGPITHLYITGYAAYDDIFGHPHRTMLCYLITWPKCTLIRKGNYNYSD